MDEDYIFTLETGTRFYAWSGIIGIGLDGVITYGYDGTIGDVGDLTAEQEFTPADRRALAKMMIERWAGYGDLTVAVSEPHEVG